MNHSFTILVVGAGGLGCPALWGLCEAWRGRPKLRLRVLDPDRVELNNLNRQVFFAPADIGQPKARILCREAAGLLSIDAAIELESEEVELSSENIAQQLAGVDLVIDATDSVSAKFLINDFCVANRIPFCYGGVLAMSGQLLAYDPRLAVQGCLRCLFGELDADALALQSATCREAGVLGPVVGAIGFLQAEAALRILLDPADGEGSELIRFDLEHLRLQRTFVKVAEDCPLGCGFGPAKILDLQAKQCPATFLYTKLALERLPANEVLDVRYSSLDSVRNVMASAAEEGYLTVVPPREIAKSVYRVLFKKKAGPHEA